MSDDGGPAFPRPVSRIEYSSGTVAAGVAFKKTIEKDEQPKSKHAAA